MPEDVDIRTKLAGWNAIRNPLTGRIVDLRDDRRRRRFLSVVKMYNERAQAEHEGINGYKFKRTHCDDKLSIYKLPLKYHIPISRASIDLPQFFSDFMTQHNVDRSALIRLSAILAENGQYVSEAYMTADELLNLGRVLFTGDSSVQYETYSRLSMVQINVLHDTAGGH